MDKTIRDQFNDQILAQAAKQYGVDPDQVEMLGGFESFVFEFAWNQKAHILRLSHSSRRTADMISGEVEWINYLADGGVPVARAVPSQNGNLVERVPSAEGYFSAVAFEKAAGDFTPRAAWQAPLFQKLGRILGRMHALTKEYQPSRPEIRRPEWEEETCGFAGRHLPPSEQVAVARFDELVARVATLPRDREAYGLVHTDVHRGNFYLQGQDEVTLFDFDDCQYSWFVDDIAMALFYAVPHDCVGEENLGLARAFFSHLMRGYRQENWLAPHWFSQIPAFLKLREIAVYAAIHAGFDDLNNLEPWCASFMQDRKEKIAQELPFIDLDFEQLASQE